MVARKLNRVVSALVGASAGNQVTFEAPVVYTCQLAAIMAFIKMIFGEFKLPVTEADVEDRVSGGVFDGIPFVERVGDRLILQHLECITPRIRASIVEIVRLTLKDCGCTVFRENPEMQPLFAEAKDALRRQQLQDGGVDE